MVDIPYWIRTNVHGSFERRAIKYLIDKPWFQRLCNRYDTHDDLVNVAASFRRQWIAKKAQKIEPNSTVIDVGAGEAPYRDLFKHCVYKTHDFMQYPGTSFGVNEEKWQYTDIDFVSDIINIPVPDASFDTVLCTEVLEHVPEPINALREMSRILISGGTLLLTVPLSAGLHQEPYHFYGGFTPYFFQMYLVKFGLEIKEITPIYGLYRHTGQEVYRSARILLEKQSERFTLLKRFLLFYWIPNYFKKIEEEVAVNEFTLGYVLEARKILPK